MEELYLENYDVHYACNCIHHFFDAFGIDHAAQYIESALKVATTQKVWIDEDPAGLLLFME